MSSTIVYEAAVALSLDSIYHPLNEFFSNKFAARDGASVFFVLAYFIYKLSRVAAVVALVLYVLDHAASILMSNSPSTGLAVVIVFTSFPVQAVGGTIAYSQFMSTDDGAAGELRPAIM
jgi:hypothetical protein